MGLTQTSYFCPQCNQMRLFQATTMNHTPHILASVFLCGLWLPIWAILALTEGVSEWRCAFCGFTDEPRYLANPGLRAESARRNALLAKQLQHASTTDHVKTRTSPFEQFTSQQLVAGGVTALMLLLAFTIFAITIYRGSSSNSGTTNQAKPTQTPISISEIERPITEVDKKYLGSVVSYLESAINANTELAYTMERQAPLPEIKRAVERARRIENGAFTGDYSRNKPTKRYNQLHTDIRAINELFNAAYDDYLRYFSTEELQHIENGSVKFKNALLRTKTTLDMVNNMLGDIKTGQKKTPVKKSK